MLQPIIPDLKIAPLALLQNFSTCTTGSELERWFDWATDSKHLREPCQTMPMIDSELLDDMKTYVCKSRN